MKLYVSAGAPNPRRVNMFAAEKGLLDQIEFEEVSILARENMGEAFTAISPFGKLPALKLPNGSVITESATIIRYLDTLKPEPNLLGASAEERAVIDMWDRRMEFLLFIPAAMGVRVASPLFAAIEVQSEQVAQHYISRLEEMTGWLDQHLKEREWIAADRITVADITALAGLDFAKIMKYRTPAEQYPHLARWREEMNARPSTSRGLPR